VEALRAGLGSGRTIAESLQPEITEMEFSVLDSTERGGQLADGCAHLAEYFALQAQTRSRILPRLLYPALLLHLAFLPGAVPRLISDGFGGFLRALLGPILIGYGLVALLVFGFRFLARRGQSDPRVDRLVNAVPLAGSMRRALGLSRFCKILEISLLAGRKPSDAVADAAGAAAMGLVRRAGREISPRLAAGESLGPLLLSCGAFPDELADALANAEEAGTLEKEAGRWARYLQAEANQTAERVAEWAPRVVYAIAVVFAVWAIYRGAMSYFNTITGFLPG
jgi:type II secretory pathway component PulF